MKKLILLLMVCAVIAITALSIIGCGSANSGTNYEARITELESRVSNLEIRVKELMMGMYQLSWLIDGFIWAPQDISPIYPLQATPTKRRPL